MERVSKVGRRYTYDCNGEESYLLLHSFAVTIVHIVSAYLRHPLRLAFARHLYLKDKATASALKRRASAFPGGERLLDELRSQ